ncbi:glucosyltransferase domain-containing protein [Butyrivibrio sp. FC2001]|uniref:glucosyltransferase domain-containing protein n=1 Tax=Butyrivibrio sp. FC2001 TaxID=1280671 RepID=UPI0018CBD608|nr:glucosyltransferase domain-containing protein [Butyrivibrio sp. FC2001]
MKNAFKKNYIYFTIYVMFGLCIYYYFWRTELPNPDAIATERFSKHGYKWEMSLGRYMLGLWQKLFFNQIHPMLFTILTIIVISFIACLTLNFLKIESRVLKLTLGMLLIANPHVISGLSYYYCFFYYSIAWLFMVLAVIVIERCKGKQIIGGIIGAATMVCVSLATYQAYMSVYIGLVALWMVSVICDFKECINSLRKVILKFISFIIAFILGVVLYLLSNRIILGIFGVELEKNRGFSSMGTLDIKMVSDAIVKGYYAYADYFLGNGMLANDKIKYANISLKTINYGCLALLLLTLMLFLYQLYSSDILLIQKVIGSLFCCILLAIFPLCLMVIVVAAPECDIYDTTGVLMIPGMTLQYIMIGKLVSAFGKNEITVLGQKVLSAIKVSFICVTIILIIVFSLFSWDTQKYALNNMERTYNVGTLMAEDIRVFKENGGKRVCILGMMEKGNFPDDKEELREKLQWTIAYYRTFWESRKHTQKLWNKFLENYIGINYKKCEIDKVEEIFESDKFKAMPNYPEKDSVVIMDDVLVIKLSD